MIHESLLFILEKEGFKVDDATNGREAFDRISRKSSAPAREISKLGPPLNLKRALQTSRATECSVLILGDALRQLANLARGHFAEVGNPRGLRG